MTTFLYVSDNFAGGFRSPDGTDANLVGSASLGSPEQLRADYVFVIGQLSEEARALQLGGTLLEHVRRGSVVVALYPGTIEIPLGGFIRELLPDVEFAAQAGLGTTLRVAPVEREFETFFKRYGRSSVVLAPVRPDEWRVLGTVFDGASHRPVAIQTDVQQGALYVLPFMLPGFMEDFLVVAFEAVVAHRSARFGRIPDYLAHLRLPGEQKVLDKIATLDNQRAALDAEARDLARFRLLMGSLNDQALEDLVIDALNVVLKSAKAWAEDRPDTGREDFWILDRTGEVAFAEVKGIGSNVRRPDVSKTDGHRDEMERDDADQLPGLLVANIFRNSHSLEDRTMAVPSHAIGHAARRKIVILRGFDLYNLVRRAKDGEKVGQRLLEALASPGGWLRVDEEGIELVTS